MLKNNKIYRLIVIPICILLSLFARFIPPFGGLSSDAIGVIFIFLSSLILWLTIGIDWPSLLCIFSLGLIPKLGFNSVFSSSFGNSTFLFLLFTFICTYALSKTSLIKRVAIRFVDNKLARKSGRWFVTLFLLSVLILGLFISPSVLFVIILPILEEIFHIAGIQKGDKIGKILMLGLGFSVSISSGMTPIAHVFPVLALNAAGVSEAVNPIKYMVLAIPVGIVLFSLMLVIFLFVGRGDFNKFKNVEVTSLKKGLQEVNKKDILTVIVFFVVILLWIIPSFFKDGLPEFYNFINQYGTAMPPLAGCLALSIIRIKDEPIIKLEDAFKNGIPWGSLLMCAATLVLGSALTSDQIGLETFLQDNLSSSLSGLPSSLLIIVFAVWAALQTNISSNMVTATLVSAIASSIIVGSNLPINLPSMSCIIGMLASFAFATPPSMPHIAIVSGSEYCSSKDVLIYGSILMVIGVIVSLGIAYPLGCILF